MELPVTESPPPTLTRLMLLVKLPVISPPNWAADVTFVNVLLLGIAITIYHVPDGMDIVESD